ncbi:ThuA domain-containing protein [Compostimonas suwonensis]|uniref:Type 1 glutamine amidotransferase n=1 Tax=Compostimonas suwonensis TaxID=1048394 RepID=A0A2M9BB82_9MICO|nr:ThuA domain-containing protein [Compostimonas suwonensis]PJJ55204.1 type 1 glutamine amidotransferase [Compostimonas suwonensis]
MKTFYPAALAAAALMVIGGAVAAAPAYAADSAEPSVLVFSKTAAFRHTECIASGTAAISALGEENGFAVDATEDASVFTDDALADYDAVVFLCTTGDILDETQQGAFERYIQAGGGYLGVHSASDTEYDWPWYGELVGAYFQDHPPAPGSGAAQFQEATVNVEVTDTPATEGLPQPWIRTDEWYNFQTNPRDDVRVLLSLDESSYQPGGYTGSTGMGDHPIAWCQPYDGGRSVYTALGHSGSFWSEPLLLQHMLGSLGMAAGWTDFVCSEPVTDADLTEDARGAVTVPDSVVQGESIVVTVGTELAGQTLETQLFSEAVPLDRSVVSAEGTLTVTVPADTVVGEHKIAVLRTNGTLVGWDGIAVLAPEPDDEVVVPVDEVVAVDPAKRLPATGAPTDGLLAAAGLLLGLGIAAVTAMSIRRRRA